MVCRAENNRYYLKKGVEVRPGYLARWIEFQVIDQTGPRSIVQIIKERHEAVVIETRKIAEQNLVDGIEGVKRDMDTKAIELRIEMEKVELGRELTGTEIQEIVNSIVEKPVSSMGHRVNGLSRGGARGEGQARPN